MSWTHYSLSFRLRSPMHIGYRKVGNLMQTRGYVPGKNLWAALTARLTRDYDDGSAGGRYVAIGKAVHKHFRFGYLWPALPADPNKSDCSAPHVTIHFPWSDPLFDYRFLSSYASTALNYDQQSAKEGTLHETEFLRPHARPVEEDIPLPVYLVGDLWVNAAWEIGSPLANWETALTHIQLGGERTYGWGRLQLCTPWKQAVKGQGETVAGLEWREESNDVLIMLPQNGHTIAHTVAAGKRALTGFVGRVEPLVGWERDNKRDGKTWRLSNALIAWEPGGLIKTPGQVSIGDYGVWEKAPAGK